MIEQQKRKAFTTIADDTSKVQWSASSKTFGTGFLSILGYSTWSDKTETELEISVIDGTQVIVKVDSIVKQQVRTPLPFKIVIPPKTTYSVENVTSKKVIMFILSFNESKNLTGRFLTALTPESASDDEDGVDDQYEDDDDNFCQSWLKPVGKRTFYKPRFKGDRLALSSRDLYYCIGCKKGRNQFKSFASRNGFNVHVFGTHDTRRES